MRMNISSVCFSCVLNIRNLIFIRNSTSKNVCPFNILERNIRSEMLFTPFCSRVKGFRLYSFNTKNDGKSVLLKEEAAPLKKPKKPKDIKTYITLLGTDKNIHVTTVEEAKKLATRRNYKLVKVNDFDPKTSRAVYQLMTESEYLKSDSDWKVPQEKKEKFVKGHKVISINSNISEHDTHTKVNIMKKWLSKRIEVRVVIAGNKEAGEEVYKIIEKEIGADGRIVQKRAKAEDIRFQIVPPKNIEQKSSES